MRWGEGLYEGDAVECVTVWYLPLWPLGHAHTWDWTEQGFDDGALTQGYKSIPIQPTLTATASVFLRQWSVGFLVIGAVQISLVYGMRFMDWIAPPAFPTSADQQSRMAAMIEPAFLFLLAGAIGSVLAWFVDQRARRIRRVLGRHELGSSDPALWHPEVIEGAGVAPGMFGASRYAEAAPRLLAAGEFSRAMFAARLCAAVEERTRGEELTDQILADPRVREALARVGPRGENWAEAMNPQAASAEG
jgi:hypothetical protein